MHDSPVNLIAPDEREFDNLKRVASSLEMARDENSVLIIDEEHNVKIRLPHTLYRVLTDVAHLLAKGDSVGLLRYTQDVTTQQAADLLQVSRPYVIKLLEASEIPYYMVGSHRRMKFADVLHYKQRRDLHRREKLDELYRVSNEARLYDIETFPQDDDEDEERNR